MQTYYSFRFGTQEILEFDTTRYTLARAERMAKKWADVSNTFYVYAGIVTR